MSIRSHRFSDNEYNVAPRTYNQSNPQAYKAIPSDFKTVQNLLIEERKRDSTYNKAWSIAEKIFKQKKQSTPLYFKATTQDECYIAVIAYTLEIPRFYEDFNRTFRQLTSDASWSAFPYKSFYYLLMLVKNGIVNGVEKSKKPQNPENQVIYRGINVHLLSKFKVGGCSRSGYLELRSPACTATGLYAGETSTHFISEPKIGEWFYFDYFASCSTDRSTAERYAKPSGTVIELEGGATEAIDIKNYSVYSNENEVLVFPTNKFKVKSFKKVGAEHTLVLVKAGTI